MKLNTTKMLADVEDGIGWITFNSPERRNAISLEMWEGLGTILESFQHDDGVRVVVMKGAGEKAFVSGADISEFDSKRGNAAQKKQYGAVSANASLWLGKLDKPLIAMIQGYCIGGGLATALSADVRFATKDSTFGIPAAKLGLGYEYGGLKVLSDLVGPSSAKDIMFSARFLDAEEALRIGLINFVVSRQELEQKVRDYAALIAANAPLTVKAAKAAVNENSQDLDKRDHEAIDQMINACFDSEDYVEGRRAFKEKRKPVFRGL
ncbi:MAG: enoyl-CoA hydratase [Gammaproteobacteria bacterium]|nr:enoyl-CoA hydratase [Gammaproteobacteria bacterium]|tara:strand:+ start:1462 stop:2256 length:795 start_codon:yes stop_codon:yes gene_type:complete